MIVKLIFFSIVTVMGSWTIGLLVNAMIIKQNFYKHLSNMNFIRSDKINRAIGVGLVRWGAMNTFFRIFNPNIRLSNKDGLDRLRELRQQMTYSEIGHLIAFVAVVIYALIMLLNGASVYAGMLMLANIFLNLHLSLLQQQNKRRIDRVIERYS